MNAMQFICWQNASYPDNNLVCTKRNATKQSINAHWDILSSIDSNAPTNCQLCYHYTSCFSYNCIHLCYWTTKGPPLGTLGLTIQHWISVIVFSFDRLNQTQYIIKKIIQGHNGTHTMLIQDYTILTSCTNRYEQSQSTCSLRANTFTPVVMYYKRRNNITVKYAWQLHVLRLPRN